MVPSQAILTQINHLFGTYILAQLTAPQWTLNHVKNNFVPGPNLVAGDVTIDPDWVNDATALSGMKIEGTNPATQGQRVSVYATEQARITGATTAHNVYGFVLREVGTGVVVASELLPQPIAIATINQMMNNPIVGFELPRNAVR